MRSLLGGWLVACVVAGAVATSASAFTSFSPPFSGGVDIATGFPTCSSGTIGPVGILFDGSKLFVNDACNGLIYRFGPAGGTAVGAEAVSAAPTADGAMTIAGGRYYSARSPFGAISSGLGIIEFDPATLAVTRTVVSSSEPRGVTTDPLTGDLYFDEAPGSIWRIPNPAGPSPSATNVSTAGSGAYDGNAFTADGSRFYVTDYNAQHVLGFDRSGAVVLDASIVGHHPDGIAVARPNTVVGGVDFSNNVFVNSNDGTIERIDTNSPGNPVSVVATGGTRGDYASVGPDGCFYVSQSDRVVKLAPCIFQQVVAPEPVVPAPGPAPASGPAPPATPAASPASAAAVKDVLVADRIIRLPSARKCLSRRRLTIHLVEPKTTKLASAVVLVNGKRTKTVKRSRITAPIVLTGLPKGRYTVKITAKTTDARTISGSRKYRTCTPKRKGTSKHRV